MRMNPAEVERFQREHGVVVYGGSLRFGHMMFATVDHGDCLDGWRWADTGSDARTSRDCAGCGLKCVYDQPDPCWGWLPGVSYACCGHQREEGYVTFHDGTRVTTVTLMPTEMPEIDDDDDDEDEIADVILRAKWTFDDATTLAEATQMLRAYADYIDNLAAKGWLLREPVKDDYAFLYHPDPVVHAQAFQAETTP